MKVFVSSTINGESRIVREPQRTGQFCSLCEKFREISAHCNFLSHQSLSSLTDFQRRLHSASEQYVHLVSVLQIRNTFYFSFCLGTEKSRHLTYVFHIFLHVELITFSAFADLPISKAKLIKFSIQLST